MLQYFREPTVRRSKLVTLFDTARVKTDADKFQSRVLIKINPSLK